MSQVSEKLVVALRIVTSTLFGVGLYVALDRVNHPTLSAWIFWIYVVVAVLNVLLAIFED